MTGQPTAPPQPKAGETISRLQRGILRLALSFHGQNPELDRRLKTLGATLRSGCKDAKLQTLIDEIVDIIVTQGFTQNDDQRGGRALADLLRRIQVRFPNDTELPVLIERLSLPVDRLVLQRTLDEAADTMVQLTTSNDAESARETGTAINHFLEELQIPTAIATRIDAIRNDINTRQTYVELIASLEEAAALLSRHLVAEDTAETTGDTRDHLLLLMNLIPFPADLTDRSAATRRRIEEADSADALYRCIPEIADLTAMMRVQLQGEIDGLGEFLKMTLARLQEFETAIGESREYNEQSLRNSLDLELHIGHSARSMREDIDGESDIDAIKAAVSSHLDSIDQRLGEFVRKEDIRNRQAGEKINEMVTALNELEFEAKELRENLERQHEQVLIDPLTGILNRSGYDESVNKEYVRWRRYKSDLSVAVIDLDMFKSINDSYGHAAGDRVLATVARQIESQIRECDILCRYGGEEFVLLLPETSIEDGYSMLEKLRLYIEDCHFHYQQTPVPVTFSCGIAAFTENDTIESVFNRADQAMYLAKRAGRNRCRTELDLLRETA